MNKRIKVPLRIVCFMIVFCLLFYLANIVFTPKWIRGAQQNSLMLSGFYDESTDTLDVIFIGSSRYYRGISPLILYERYGITGYVRGGSMLAPLSAYYYLKDTLEYQSPSVVVLGLNFFNDLDYDSYEGKMRLAFDYMPLSWQKFEGALDIAKASKWQTVLSYLFPLLRYHERWKDLSPVDFSYLFMDRHYATKGWNPSSVANSSLKRSDRVMDITYHGNAVIENETTLYYFDKIAQLCKKNGIELLILQTPSLDWNYARHQSVQKLAEHYGVTFYDYNLNEIWDEVGFDPKEDFYDKTHLNFWGAEKLNPHLGAYLRDRYGLPDRRGDTRYASWDEDVETLFLLRKEMNGIPYRVGQCTAQHLKQKVVLEWQAVEGVTSYTVYRSKQKDSGFSIIQEGLTDTVYVDSDVDENTNYYYLIRSFATADGQDVFSPYTAAAAIVGWRAPQDVALSQTDEGTDISWTPVPGAEGYKVFRSTRETSGFAGVVESHTGNRFIDTTYAKGQAGYYKVAAYITINGERIYSPASGAVWNGVEPARPTPPKKVNISVTKDGILIKWEPVDNVDGYKVLRSMEKDKNYSGVKDGTKMTRFTDTNVDEHATYYYKVMAYRKEAGKRVYSDSSEVICVKSD